MPELLITRGLDRRPARALAELDEWSLLAVHVQLLFPGDTEKWDDVFFAARLCGRGRRLEPKPPAYRIALHYLKHIPGENRGRLAGVGAAQVLMHLKMMAEDLPEAAWRGLSFTDAYETVARDQNSSVEAARAAWTRARDMSHLWLAAMLAQVEGSWLDALRLSFEGPPARNVVRDIVSYGEGLLRWAEAEPMGAGKGAKPVLDPAEAWRPGPEVLASDIFDAGKAEAVRARFASLSFDVLKRLRAAERV